MDHHHKRRQKPLLVHRGRYIGTSRWGVARIVHLCPPQGACESVNPHGGEGALVLGRKGGLINRGANEQQGEEARRGGGGGSIDPSRGTSS